MFNKKINRKGFAVTTMLYGLVFVTIAIFFGTITIASNHKEDNDKFVENIRDNIEKNDNSNSLGESGGNQIEDFDLLLKKMIDKYFYGGGFMEGGYNDQYYDVEVDYDEGQEFEIKRTLKGTNSTLDNYVWYSGKLWRITTLYPDGTMTMVTDDVITNISYGSSKNYSNTSWIYQWLNEDFKDTLYNYKNIIVESGTWASSIFDYNYGYSELSKENSIKGNIGLLNLSECGAWDEFSDNGSIKMKNRYENHYLNDGFYWYTSDSYNSYGIFVVDNTGTGNIEVGNEKKAYGIRPAIRLKNTVMIFAGEGTKENPYLLSGDIEGASFNVTKLNTRISGEYVKFDNNIYRIVGTESYKDSAGKTKVSTKLTSIDSLKDEEKKEITKKFSSTANYGSNMIDDNYWDYYLNNTWYDNISDGYKEMMVEGTYYLGKNKNASYKSAICKTVSNTVTTKACAKTTSTWKGYVGLPRLGEMFSVNKSSSPSWLITPVDNLNVYGITAEGAIEQDISLEFAVHPTITLGDDVIIIGGNGRSPETAFEISLPIKEEK